jgi:hypothetical protein
MGVEVGVVNNMGNVVIAELGLPPSMSVFCSGQAQRLLSPFGGFKHHNIINDVGSETRFLALSYPLLDQEFNKLKDRLGCLDL